MEEQKKSTLSLSHPVGLKGGVPPFSAKVRQSFSHGKSKVVAVEVKKRRLPADAAQLKVAPPAGAYGVDGNLTNSELETRLKVVKEAIKESREQEVLRAQREEMETQNSSAVEETSDLPPDAAKAAVINASETPSLGGAPKIPPHRSFRSPKDVADEDDSAKFGLRRAPGLKRDVKELKGRYDAASGRISIYNALEDNLARTRSLTSLRRARQKNKFAPKNQDDMKIVKEVILPETIGVQELSNRMAIRTGEVIKALMKMGVMVTANQIIDADTAELVILELGHRVKRVSDSDVEIGLKKEDSSADLLPRPPVVTIMGHVDHGKTSLLDALRKTDVALKEAGGITQGIGAYQVTMKDGRRITFIDTPGHAAFTEMRSRGANVTDVVVLVVAADDGVKDQTIEAINHAKAAGVPIVVAINKIDKYGVNPEHVRKELLNHEIVVEGYGGSVIDVEISAKTGINLEKLEESILLQAEILDLRANPNRAAEGVVVESQVEKGLGPVATVLINKGTLKVGDVFVSGVVYGRVRAIRTDMKESLETLTPGMPGEIIGFNGSSVPGDDFVVVENEWKAKEIAGYRERKKREQSRVVSSRTADQMFSQLSANEKLRVLPIIIKADVQGSSEAIHSSLQKLSTDEVAVNVLHYGVGEITESDVVLARASNALILGFNVRANVQARDQIMRDKI
ncbi:MAG: translation initiation factor IF-2, partial [Holosporaceae bacterium]|nr:translation initiation factor IF-2 [Holosporaceae bacterium]